MSLSSSCIQELTSVFVERTWFVVIFLGLTMQSQCQPFMCALAKHGGCIWKEMWSGSQLVMGSWWSATFPNCLPNIGCIATLTHLVWLEHFLKRLNYFDSSTVWERELGTKLTNALSKQWILIYIANLLHAVNMVPSSINFQQPMFTFFTFHFFKFCFGAKVKVGE